MFSKEAFGGVDRTYARQTRDIHSRPRTQSGRGYRHRRGKISRRGVLLPNIENPRHIIPRPTVMRRSAADRLRIHRSQLGNLGHELAGTYDESWNKTPKALASPNASTAEVLQCRARRPSSHRPTSKADEPVRVIETRARTPRWRSICRCRTHLSSRVQLRLQSDQGRLSSALDTVSSFDKPTTTKVL